MLAPLWAPLETAGRRRTGGWRQRLESEADAAPPSRGMSRLAAGHLLDWGDGVVSASKLQWHMAHCLEDEFDHPMIQRLAAIGAAQNAQAGLLKLLESCGIPQLITPIDGRLFSQVMLPSTWLRLLHKDYPRQFRLSLGADKLRLRDFWTSFRARPATREWSAAHPFLMAASIEDLETTIPLTIHVDAAPCSKKKSFLSISFASLLRQGEEKRTQFVCATCVKADSGCCDVVWNAILADMDSLATGAADGNDIACGSDGVRWKAVLLIAKADEQARCEEFGLSHYNGEEPCSECMCNRTTRPSTGNCRVETE
jgi:hypothetical protein